MTFRLGPDRRYLPYGLLVKMDIATMANSLEARSPLLDHKVMEFAARLPAAMNVKGRSLKYLPRKYAEKLLPPAALNRRKMGFGVPVGDWMKTDLKPKVDDTLVSNRAATRGYLRPQGVRALVNDHQAGRQDRGLVVNPQLPAGREAPGDGLPPSIHWSSRMFG